MKLTKRLLAMLLTVVMVLSMLPAIALTASAADTTETLTASDFAATGTSYAASSGVSKGGTARYAAYTAKNSSNIQFNKKQNCYIVSTTSGGKVKSVTVTIASGSQAIIVKGSNTAYTTSNAYSNGTEIARGTSTFTATPTTDYEYFAIVGNANGAVYISSVQVVWTSGASKTLSSISLSGSYPTSFTTGDTFDHTGMVVTATYSDSTTADVTSSATWSSPNMSTAGTKTVTVSYTEGGTTKTATYDITVTAPTPATITLSRNGATQSVTGYYVGDSYTLPGAGADVNGHKHVGWSSVTIPTPGSKPTTNYYDLGAEIPSLGSSQTYYAVYAIQEGSGNTETRWKLAPSIPTTSTTVILAGKDSSGNYYAMNSANTSSVTYVSCTAITVDDDMIDKDTTTTAYEFTFNPSDPSFTGSGNGKLVLNSSSLRINTGNANPPTSVTMDDNGYTVIYRSTSTKYVVFAGSSNGFGQAGSAATSATTAVYMFTQQEVGGATYSGYTTAPQAQVNPTYTVSVTSGITGGSISASPATAEEGDTITVTATPNTGYELTALTYTPAGGSATNISTSTKTFTMPAANVTVNATFSKINYTITKSAGANGSITAAATANYQDTVNFTVTPASGYQINTLTVTRTSGGAAVTYTDNGNGSYTISSFPAANVTIAATFSALPTYSYTIYNNSVEVDSGTAASVTAPTAPASIQYTDPDTLTTSTFTFAGWAVQSATIAEPGSFSGTLYQPGETIPLSANDTVIRAIFVNGSGGNGFKLSLESGGETYYVGARTGSNTYLSVAASEDAAAEFGYDTSNGHDYLYYLNGSDKIYIYNNASDTSIAFTSANTLPSGSTGFEYWTVTESNGTITFLNGTGTRYLAFNNDRFSTYTPSQNQYPYEFTKISGSSYLTEAGANYYAVTYYENAGSDTVTNMPSNTSVREGSSYTIPNTIPVRDGYRFDGWATSAGGAVVYAASSLPATISSVSAAVNLYAKWTLRATVTFYDTDNTTIFDTVYTYAGETPTAPASNPTKADSDPHYYTFAGWSCTAGGTVESPLAVIGSSESTRAYYPVFTEHTRIEAVDDSFVLDFDRNATLDVLANDRNTDGVTLTLGTAPAGITLTKNANNTITFTVPGGQLTTASYTFTYTLSKSGETDSTATVTVKPASAIYYEDSNSFFTYTDGTQGKWSVVGNDNAWTQSAIDTDSESAVGYDESANSLTWSAGVTHKANVGNSTDYGTSGSSETWPYMEFTFLGNAFTLSMMRNNYTGLISVYVDGTKVKNVATSYGATGGAYDPDKPNGGFIYESSESNYGMPTFYWKAENGAVGTHTVKVQVLYSPTFEHNDPKVGNYDVYIDGVTIYNPIAGSTAYNYISFRDTVLATGSLGVPTTTPHNYVATLSPASLSLNTGNTGVLQLSLTDENVPVYSGYTVVYTSSNPSIATVTPAGSLNATTGVNTATVTGVSAGQATITATITTPGSTTLTRTATVIVSETGKTVNYYVNGTVWDSEQVAEGNDPSFPNVIGAYNELAGYSHDYTFLGWIPAAIAEDTTAQPATIYTSGDSYELTGATAFHAVFRYSVSGSSGSEFTLSYTNNDTTYYMGMDNGNSRIAVSTDEAEAASYGLEQIGESEYYYLYYLDASSNKVYVTGNAGSSNSRDLTFSSTAPSSGYYKWQVDENGKFWSYNASNEQGGAVAINSSDKVYARMYTSGQWGEFVQNATGTTTRYYATTLGAAGAITHSYEASITPTSLALHVGETGSVSATLTDNGATVTGATPTYTTSMSSVATVAADGTVTAVANGNATITATFTVGGTDYTATCSVAVTTLATYNVTYMVNGSQYGQIESVVQGNSPSFTAPSYDVSSYNAHAYEFLGWKEGSALSADTTETQTLYVAGNTRVISGNTTYYAVYRYTEGGGALTEAIDLSTGASGQYVIAANVGGTYYAMHNSSFSGKLDRTQIATPGSSISSSDATGYAVTIEKSADGWTISNGTNLLGYPTSGTDFTNDTHPYWSITTGSHGSYRVTNTNTTTRAITYRTGTVNKFAPYATNNINGTEYYDVEIIPVGDSSSATYYATTLNVAAAHNYVASISPTSVTIEAGQETTAIGTLTDNGITTTAYTPTYSSSNTGVATVSSIGYVDAISAGTANITVSYDVDGTTYSAVCAVTVTPATVVTSYTVSYYVNGSLFETETVAENGHPEFDAPTTDISAYDAQDYTFAGWAANTVNDTTTAPMMYTASTASSYTVTGDVTFHAVYTWSEGGSGSGSGTASYTKVTSTSDLADGKYLIVCENVSMAMTDAVDGTSNGTSVTIDNGTIASSSAVDALQFTLTKSNGALQGPNGKYIGNASNSNSLTASETALTNTITFSSGDANIVGSGGAYLRYNKTSGQDRFRYFKSSSYTNQQAVQLYKYVAGSGSGSSGTDYYTTTLAAGDGTTASLSVSPSSMSLSTGGYGQIAVTAANGGANAYVTATSSSNSVAQVYALNDGNNTFGVSAGSAGSATITIRYLDSSNNQLASQTVSVTVTAASGTGGTNADYGRVGSDGNAPTTSGSTNAGTRGVVATSISQKAADYYTAKGVTWADLTALSGVYTNSSVTAASGNALKSQLDSLMNLTNTVTYSSLTTYWPNTDKSNGSSQNLYIYSNVTSNSSVSREHVWPKSRGQFYESGAGSDLQHLRPEESTVNSTRGNHTMGYVNGVISGCSTKTYGGNTVLWYSGSYSSNDCSGLVEVMDCCKGDVARILLYVYTAYPENTNLFTKTSGGGSGNNASDGNKVIESLNTLLEWCALDPVDTWEMSRNDAVQTIQGNRNVYIDYPELAWMIFNLTPPTTMQTPSGQAAAGNVGTRNSANYYTSAVNNTAVMSADPAPATRGGATRAIGDENTNLPVTGAVMLDGIGQISNSADVMSYLEAYGAKNCLVVPADGAVVFYLTGGSADSKISIGASALNSTGTTLKVYQISAVSGSSATGTVLLEQSLVSSTEMYFRIQGIAWTGDKSNVLMVRNEGSAPMLLTNLRSVSGLVEGHISTGDEGTSDVGSATRGITRSTDNELQMVIDSSAILAGMAAVEAVNEGTFDETPVTPVDPVDPVESDIVLLGNSISLNGQIDVNFYLDISDELFDDGVYATIDGVKVDFTEGQYGTMVSKKLPAKEMNTKVTLKLYAADGTPLTFKNGSADVTEHRYSVQDYLTYVISNPATYGDELVNLCKAMSDYGVYTQRELGFDVENAKDIYLADEIANVTCEGYGYGFTPNTENISFLGASVVTESETAIRVYFALSGEGFTATVDGEPAAIQTNERGAFVEIANISAKNLGDPHTVAITNGSETVTITNCSAYSYVQSVLGYAGASDSLKLAAKALKLYGDLAAEYFNK